MERQAASVWAVVSVISSPQVEKIWKKRYFEFRFAAYKSIYLTQETAGMLIK